MCYPYQSVQKGIPKINKHISQHIRSATKPSVRTHLLALALLPMLVVMPLLLGVTVVRWTESFDSLLISKVNGDLTIAHQYLSRLLEHSGEKIQALGASASFIHNVEQGSDDELLRYFNTSRERLGFDFLYLIKPDGEIIASSPSIKTKTDMTKWPLVQSALGGSPNTVIDIFTGAELSVLSPTLAKQAQMDLLHTQAAVATERTVETRGMVIHSAATINNASQHGALVGGILLNRNLAFIDKINDLVYRETSLPTGSTGTATLFLEDVRISTNVRLFKGKRALGTRVSAVVRKTVLEKGKVWLNRAFVVNDWYISGYEPIIDSKGNRVGMLYVGFLEKPFLFEKYTTLVIIATVFLIVAAISVPILLRSARSIFKPLERMTHTIALVERGDMSARVGAVARHDEIGRVAFHLDSLLQQLQERDQQLRDWTSELNNRVEERTHALKEANLRLETTTHQLVLSEKLAAIGELTASVAHEINNPIAVIQGNLDVIRDMMGSKLNGVKTEMQLIEEQVYAINLIVSKLLQLARPEEYAGLVEPQCVDQVLTNCLLLVQHLLDKIAIKITRKQGSKRLIMINRTELQQVFINLIVNAIQSMPNGGLLSLSTYDQDYDDSPGLVIKIADTGTGIAAQIVDKIFNPFFTTKRRTGTGLGLSITQTLITRHGGHISVESTENKGTIFSIWMPAIV